MGYRRILIAVDLTPESRQVLTKGLAASRRYDAEVTILHVVEPLLIEPIYDGIAPLPAGWDTDLLASAERTSKTAIGPHVTEKGCARVEIGSTKQQILRVADEWQADVIILGSHGRRGISLLLGSTANAISHHAPCDVLAVRVALSER